jgi:hypothetical protein
LDSKLENPAPILVTAIPTIEGRWGWIQSDEARSPSIGNNPNQHSKAKKKLLSKGVGVGFNCGQRINESYSHQNTLFFDENKFSILIKGILSPLSGRKNKALCEMMRLDSMRVNPTTQLW